MHSGSHIESTWKAERKTGAKLFLSAINLVNVAFAFASVFLWSLVALVLADPISWATWSSLGSIGHRPGLLEYPFVLLWLLPILGSAVAVINNLFGLRRLAIFSAVFPLLLFGLTIVWWTAFRDGI